MTAKEAFNRFFQLDQDKTASAAKQLARQGIRQILPRKQTRRPLPCLLFPAAEGQKICMLESGDKGEECTLYSTTAAWLAASMGPIGQSLAAYREHPGSLVAPPRHGTQFGSSGDG